MILAQIVRALAERSPIYAEECSGDPACALCHACWPELDGHDHPEQHDSDCPWRRAVEWVAAQTTGGAGPLGMIPFFTIALVGNMPGNAAWEFNQAQERVSDATAGAGRAFDAWGAAARINADIAARIEALPGPTPDDRRRLHEGAER